MRFLNQFLERRHMNIQVRVIPELQTVIITAVVLLILYIIFKKFLYKPVARYMQNRSDLIQAEIDEAKDLKSEAKYIKENQEKIINNANVESKKIIEEAKKTGDEIKDNILKEAKREAKEIIMKAEKEAEKQKIEALEDMKNQSVDLAILIAQKIMEEQLNVDKQNLLIDKFVEEVGVSHW